MLTEFFLLLRLEAFVENGQFLALISCAVALVFVTLSCCAAWLARGSTAVPAALWSAAAAFFFALSMLQQADGEHDITSMAIHRVVVAALSVCPVVSLLGAKRPQHGVWQLIVGTLAAVLTLPAASAVLIRPGSLPDLHILGRCLLPILVLVGWLNFVGTRRAVAATLIAVGHICLIRPLLPGVRLDTTLPQAAFDLFAIVFLTVGSGLALVQTVYVLTRRRASSSISDFSSYDNAVFARCVNNCFFPLRETLGAAWTLRLAERFNTLADQRSWPVRLTFHGFQMRDAGKGEEWQPDAARALEALLRRFVSSAWLKRHGWERASLFNQHKMR